MHDDEQTMDLLAALGLNTIAVRLLVQSYARVRDSEHPVREITFMLEDDATKKNVIISLALEGDDEESEKNEASDPTPAAI